MLLEAVVRFDDRGRTAFGGDGVAAHGVDLRYDCDVQPGVGLDCGDRRTQTGRAAADHDDVVLGNLVHLVCFPIRPSIYPPPPPCRPGLVILAGSRISSSSFSLSDNCSRATSRMLRPVAAAIFAISAALSYPTTGARAVASISPRSTSSVRRGPDRDFVAEARYWLAETYYRLDRFQQADALFRQVAGGQRTSEFAVWSLHSSGWTALRLNQMARARDTFTQFQTATPSVLEAWARHGLGLANYALGRHDEAVAAWTGLASRGAPAPLARDVSFWLGEALGRAGQYEQSVRELTLFVRGGPHPLLEAGWARLGWWSLAAERYLDSTTAFRAYLASSRSVGPERQLVEAGAPPAPVSPPTPGAANNSPPRRRRPPPL